MTDLNVRTILIMIFISCAFYSQTNTASAKSRPAEQLYETAFKLIVTGNYGEAYDRLDELITKYPDTVYAKFATNRKQRLESLNLPHIRHKQLDQSGRMGTVGFSTLYSTWLGIGPARLVDNEDDGKAVAAGIMIGGPVGLMTALILTRNARLTRGNLL